MHRSDSGLKAVIGNIMIGLAPHGDGHAAGAINRATWLDQTRKVGSLLNATAHVTAVLKATYGFSDGPTDVHWAQEPAAGAGSRLTAQLLT